MDLIRSRTISPARIALAAVAMLAMSAGAAMAQNYPGGAGPSQVYDPVTGYLCVDHGCTRVYFRPPGVNCICVKDNPNTQRLDQVHLTCQTKERGQWVSCPVTPRYGG